MWIETDYRALIGARQAGKGQTSPVPPEMNDGVVVIGNFDGVHAGHRALLAQARKQADKRRMPLIVLTFHPHPRMYFNPRQDGFLLTMPAQKYQLLRGAGADYVVSIKFDSFLANADADDFMHYVLAQALRADTVFVGRNFVFGKERSGDIDTLYQGAEHYGFQVEVADIIEDTSLRISSERIRAALRGGELREANHLLSRPFQIMGKVITGHQRGRTIGFPTANISLGEYVQPALGAYIAKVMVTKQDRHVYYNAVANIGKRPTIGDFNPLIEVHLLDFAGDLYGQELRVDFLDFLRPEHKFDSVEALKEQIEQDIIQARNILGSV